MGASDGAVCLDEPGEQLGQDLRANSHTRVGDGELDPTVDALEVDGNATSVRSELDGVGEQVVHDLQETRGVSVDHVRDGIDRGLHVQPFGLRSWTDEIGRLLNHPCKIDGAEVQHQLPGDDPRDVEQVADELRLSARPRARSRRSVARREAHRGRCA